MRKLIPLLILLLCGSTVSLNAQVVNLQEREAEWKSYSLPQTNFTRHVAAEKKLVFRTPADWKQEEPDVLAFTGPHEAQIRVFIHTVPDGYPLTEYVAQFLKEVGGLTNSPESILTRRTQFQDLEASEIGFEAQGQDGNMLRSTSWLTISGPLAISVTLMVSTEHAAAVEPFFKAIVQSVMFVPADKAEFENMRSSAIKAPAPGPVHEVENVVATLNEPNSDRERAINRLTSLFVSQPDSVIDLLIDRRPLIRSAAAEALARSKNAALKRFLWHVLDDSDPFVAEAAARRLAHEIDIAAQLLNRSWTKHAAANFARVWPFMSKENRIKLLQGLLSQAKPDRDTQIGGLILLSTMTPDEMKLPLARITAANHDPLTNVALQVANWRGESLPVDTLMRLTASRDKEIKKRAVESLGQSAGVLDIPKLEALLSKTTASVSPSDKEAEEARKALDEEIRLSIKKIRFRNDLSLAKDMDQGRKIILQASSDNDLDDFAWRYHCELTTAGCSPAASRHLSPDFKVKTFAENLFPKKVTHYTAIPNPGQTVERFHQTLNGLQLESPRAQASLILVMGRIREGLGQQLSAPPEAAALIDYTGIKPDSPIVFGAWSAAGAPASVAAAQRRAIVVRVKDRERFERVIENYQDLSGFFTYLTDYFAIGTRSAAALPALLPFMAKSILSTDVDKADTSYFVKHSVVGQTEWNGIPIKSIEHRWVGSEWEVTSASTYLTFIGDVAILTSNIATIRDLLSHATTSEEQLLAGNEEFRRAVAADGDIVYFSDLNAVFANPADKVSDAPKNATESGALKFSNSMWENFHRFGFEESEWSKPLLPFHPKELSAPRELLPSSTLAYYLMKLDLAAAWQTWPKAMNIRDNRFEIDPALWSLDFTKEVLPELGPECGAVLLEMPDFNAKEVGDGTWTAFCKLKSNKLAEALAAGKLFRNVGPTTSTAEIKSGESSYFVGVKNGFIVVSNESKGVAAMDGKTKLAATRDYSRAAEKVPANIIAFGGYNLEAAVAAAGADAGDGHKAQVAGMIFSIASAFHSQSFYAIASAGSIEGRSSVAMDREGRYAVADFSYLPRGVNITYVTLQPRGLPILDQKRLSNIVVKVRAKAPGPIDNIKDDIKSATQTVEQKSPNELVVTVAARRPGPDKKIQLPVTKPELAAFLKPTDEITSENPMVTSQAREIAGDDRDAWSVAQKLGDWTYKNLEWKSVARAGAAQTLATREADCSEFSQLYVSMARSLGLPARIVSGLAYSGNSFGGHAWVEVWIGEWVELDPTWGTHFVDATHIRNEARTLLTAAGLKLIDLEVLETRRTVAEFQKSPKALAEHLAKAITSADKTELEAATDLATLTDEFMGAGAWNGLNDHERDRMSSAFRRVLSEIISTYGKEGKYSNNIHLLSLNETGDRAEALYYSSYDDILIRLRLLRRGEVWYLVDLVQPDPGHHLVAERIGPVIKSIEATRGGKKTAHGLSSPLMKVLHLIDSDASVKALEEAERLLQTNPADQTYRFLKMIALWESSEDSMDESMKMLRELSYEHPAFAPAVYRLAGIVSEGTPEEAIELYKQYSQLEPYDLRGYRDLAAVYESMEQRELAEAAYRKAIAVDPLEIPGYRDLAIFLIRNGRVAEVNAVLLASDKYAAEDDDVIGDVLGELEEDIKLEDVERLAASEPQRMKKSFWATIHLGDIYVRDKRYREGLELMKRAAQMDPESSYPHHAMASTYLKQSRLIEALKAIDHSLKLDETSSSSYYLKACILARSGRKKDAMTALHKSIELDPEVLSFVPEDEDLKSLRPLPAFQKLLREAEKQRAEEDPK